MSNPTSISRLVPKKPSNPQSPQTENEFETSSNSIHFPPPRTPLNTIPDPSQYQRETTILYSDKDNLDGAVNRAFGTKFDGLDQWTPRVSSHRGKWTSELSSAQSTPARSSSRVSIGGAGGNSRVNQCSGARGGLSLSFSSRVPRGVQSRDVEVSKEVPHFELEEDCSFWADHNVQVLIRVRPLNNLERASQGYGRCLRQENAQTLAWLGHPETRFTFDHVACETISQEKLFRVAGLPMVENCLSGYNSCMFAYGQTGSGKTYTMMGEIQEAEDKLSEDCGMTPRIFEHLFMRIRKDEEGRRDEKLVYSCKCSFLEIYNEQITDLLEPSSTNLQLREDMRKGVYVENLTEYNVRTVGDVIKLLVQGAANRKMAATRMNSESSRSHSVFTCIIESHWEKDSMSHFRFARLNLVDLAGSERQKSSGAEGDRLKEAANINKSLSTLGLVIMSLVDLAHGKHRHIPYRDSRLTFLLQDSLGGNSKTMIIANVSASICSASETLSTLKFAQRAKLIQNNAKVNEDASGDVSALQRQVQQLKDQLTSLMKYHVRPMSNGDQRSGDSPFRAMVGESAPSKERMQFDNSNFHHIHGKEHIESLQTTLVGSLRRERMAEIEVTKLKAEIEHINILASKMQEDAKRTDVVLKFREEKIKRLELLVDGKLSAKKYLMEENTALVEEIHLLQERMKNNPETTRFALEKNRLLEQLQMYHNFVDLGEREILLLEVSDLRNQLLNLLDGNQNDPSRRDIQDTEDLAECQRMNSKLITEVEELRVELQKSYCSSQGTYEFAEESFSKDFEEVRQLDKYSPNSEVQKDMVDARMIIDVMEAGQVQLIKELQLIKEENLNLKAMLSKNEQVVNQSPHKYANRFNEPNVSWNLHKGLIKYSSEETERQGLLAKLHKTKQEVERITSHTNQYGEEALSQLSCLNDYSICQQVEMETAKTILNLQDEISALQLELHEKLSSLTQENLMLKETIAIRQEEFEARGEEWEKGMLELTSFLADGSRSLKDATSQVASIANSFPQVNDWIKEHVERAAAACIEKEEAILLLQRSLENAWKTVMDMELKLSSLKSATASLSESQHLADVGSTKEAMELNTELDEKINVIKLLEEDVKRKNKQIDGAEKNNEVLLILVKWLLDCYTVPQRHSSVRSMEKGSKLANYFEDGDKEVPEMMPQATFLEMEHVNAQVELARQGILELQSAITACHAGAEMTLLDVRDEIHKAFYTFRELIQSMSKEMNHMRIKLTKSRSCEWEPNVQSPSFVGVKPQNVDHHCHVLYQIRDGLAETNTRLRCVTDGIKMLNLCGCLTGDEGFIEANETYSSGSTSDSAFSGEGLMTKSSQLICSSSLTGKAIQLLICDAQPHHLEAGAIIKSFHESATVSCLREKLETAFAAFNKQYAQLIMTFNEMDAGSCPFRKANQTISYSLASSNSEDGCRYEEEVEFSHANRFLIKFKEVSATIREADVMLNSLLKANEDAKSLTDVWKHTSEALVVEKTNLNEEVKQLQSSLKEKEKENESFDDYIHAAILEIANSISSMEEQFLQVQKYAFHMFEVIHSDVLTLGQDLLHLIHNSRLSVEEVSCQMMEKGFAQFLLHQCLISELLCKYSNFCSEFNTTQCKHQEHPVRESNLMIAFNDRDSSTIIGKNGINGSKQHELIANFGEGEASQTSDNFFNENAALREELNRKDILLEGLLFDISLLQETASSTKELKDETQKLVTSLSMVQKELDTKTTLLNHMVTEHSKLESHFRTTQDALRQSISDLQQASKTIDALSEQNLEMKALIKDLHARESQAKQQLDEQKEVMKGLDEEILHLTSSVESKLLSSIGSIEDDLKLVAGERDSLRDEVLSLNNKLDLAYSLADENEAIAVEARQESEASRIYAEQKEEEVKILENSVEELEHTINMLEKKVNEMEHDVERYRLIRDSLEMEIQALRERLSIVENFTENLDLDSNGVDCFEDQATREKCTGPLALCEAEKCIKHLELEKAELEREIRECKDYISEVELHADAQASQYQQKYKSLEAMIYEVRNNVLNSASNTSTMDKNDSGSLRTRGSSSPFRCISNVIQQMNMEKEQELTAAKLRIQELEALAASQQKEVCMLNTRLAAAESMTHDVIRDLLSVKLDMTSYANLIEQHNIHKFVEAAYRQTEEYQAKEQEVLRLRKQIKDLIEERESCMDAVNRREADLLAARVTFEQHKQREQLLTAQNEMLKMDKANLKRRVTELDEMVKKLSAPPSIHKALQQKALTEENGSLNAGITEFNCQIGKSEKLLSSMNDDELALYQNPTCKYFMENTRGRSSDTEDRK